MNSLVKRIWLSFFGKNSTILAFLKLKYNENLFIWIEFLFKKNEINLSFFLINNHNIFVKKK